MLTRTSAFAHTRLLYQDDFIAYLSPHRRLRNAPSRTLPGHAGVDGRVLGEQYPNRPSVLAGKHAAKFIGISCGGESCLFDGPCANASRYSALFVLGRRWDETQQAGVDRQLPSVVHLVLNRFLQQSETSVATAVQSGYKL